MTSILVDSSGSPVLDAQGNVQMVANKTEFRQRIMNAFKTQNGTELFFPDYGFDFITAARLGPNGREEILKMLTLEALNFNTIQDLMIINDVSVYLQTGAATTAHMSGLGAGTVAIIELHVTDTSNNQYNDIIGVAY